MDYKERLRNFADEDVIYQEYKKGILKEVSDFDKFCIQHCEDIEKILKEVECLQDRIAYLERSNNRREETILELREENLELQIKIEKAIELIKNKTKIIPLEEGGGLELCDYDIRNLLEILKDSDVDE